MPQLTRLRLCCIGPAMARIDDMTLSFHDATGQPVNSTLWLRNGGGKTFIMQLFLWLMCPDKRMTLTGRSIEDYIQSQDRSVIIAEWQLDGSSYGRALNEPNRYLTGVFCEWHSDRLQRLFFVARVHPDELRLTLEGLPIYSLRNERAERRTLNSFKQEWQALGNAFPSAEINETENLHTWSKLLEQAGIDPTLFGYQMKMNIREGGAEDLFKFRDADRFVDFFLELMADTTLGDTTAQTIEKFRTAFQQQTDQLQPEQHLLCNLIEQLEPLRGAADEREQMYHSVLQVRQTLNSFAEAVTQNLSHLQKDRQHTERLRDNARRAAERLHMESRQKQQRAAILSHAAAQKRVQRLENELELLQDLVKKAQLDERIWRAAGVLRHVLQAEQHAAMFEKRLAARQKEHEPLHSKVQESAYAYAAALGARIEQLRVAEERWMQTKAESRMQAHAAQIEGANKQSAATRSETEAKQLAERLATFYKTRAELESAGVLLSGEECSQAQDRLSRQRAKLNTTIQTIRQAIKRIEQEKKLVQYNISQCEREMMQAGKEEELIRKQLDEMQNERNAIEADSRLQQYLELENIDLDRLNEDAVNQLQDAEHAFENRLTELKLALLEHENIIVYLTEHHLLPPTKDVESTLKVLKKQGVTAWSGWEFIDRSVRKSDVRAMLQCMPELAFGIVVRDEHFKRAQDILGEAPLHLDTLVIVAPQEATLRNTPSPLFIIGPTSDAHFNRDTAALELSNRHSRYDQVQQHHLALVDERNKLRASVEKLRNFFKNYPQHRQNEWLVERDEMVKQRDASGKRLRQLQDEYEQLEESSEQNDQLRDDTCTELNGVDKRLSLLQAHADLLNTNPDDLEQQHHHLLSKASNLRYEANQLQAKATELDQQAENASNHVKNIAIEKSDAEKMRSLIKYLNDSPQPRAGDIQALQNLYEQLVAEYEQKIGVNEITVMLQEARKDTQSKRSTLSKHIQGIVSEAMVREALDSLSDSNDDDEVDDRYRGAIQTKANAAKDIQSTKDSLMQASQVVRDTKKACIELDIPESTRNEDIPESEESCMLEEKEKKRQAQDAEGNAHKHEKEVQELVEQMSQLDNNIHCLDNDQNLIKHLLEKHQALFDAACAIAIPFESVSIELDADSTMQHELQILRDLLDGEQKRQQRLEQKRNDVAQDINKMLSQTGADYPRVTIARQFLNQYNAEHYERRCNQLLDELAVRKQQVETALASIGEHRQLTVAYMLELADSGIELLKRAAKRSKLPTSLPEFQQQPFLRIILKDSVTMDERKAKIDDLLERCMKEGAIPSGLNLLQRAVRCLASPMKVEMLFPDSNNLHYIPVAEVAKESGGERLTSFVLLYCSLVQLRATERTKHADASSTLILDNPYGAVSRPTFLELQREVARSMRIQLIYATGIHDIEAIRMISNVVRLRNDSVDRKTGEHLLQLYTPYQGLQSMRVTLPTVYSTLQQDGH